MADSKNKLRDFFIFREPKDYKEFVLTEDKQSEKRSCQQSEEKPKKNRGLIKKLIMPETDQSSVRSSDLECLEKTKNEDKKDSKKLKINKDIKVSLEYMKKVYSVPKNGDMVVREFEIVFRDKMVPAFLMYFDGLADRNLINESVLKPLMLLSNLEIKGDDNNVVDYVKNHLLHQGQITLTDDYEKVIFMINFGGCGIFIDGVNTAFAADVKGWEHRGVEKPSTELVIRGPQEGFGEILRVNTALVRKILKDDNLIVEDIIIGKRSQTPCSMLYIKDIANDSLVDEVRRRLEGVKIDHLFDSGELEQLIEDNTYFLSPQVMSTERPDRVARYLSDGKISIIINGSPFALIVPATLWDFLHSSEDEYIRFPYANLLRGVRILAIIITLFLPGLYIAITNYHHEMIPTDLLLAIEASREKVPFPSLIELLIMEVSFELIREAGIRIPGPIGPTLGIIGALILGQAAVSANIVSPILIIIVAVTGIGSFAIPNFSLAYSFRLQRFAYIALGAISGFLGISIGLFIQVIWMANSKSFGVPYLVPFAPPTSDVNGGQVFRRNIWKQETRPDDLNVKSKKKQPSISRRWKYNKDEN